MMNCNESFDIDLIRKWVRSLSSLRVLLTHFQFIQGCQTNASSVKTLSQEIDKLESKTNNDVALFLCCFSRMSAVIYKYLPVQIAFHHFVATTR